MEKSVTSDPFPSNSKRNSRRLASLLERVHHVVKEEKPLNDSNEVPTSNDGDGNSDASPDADFYAIDKNRIYQLIMHLTKCTQEKNAAQTALAALKVENKELQNQNQFLNNEIEREKNSKIKLSKKNSEMIILRQRTTQFFEILSKQIALQETEFTKLSETVKDLLREKILLENSLIEKNMKINVTEAQIERMKEQIEMEKLLLLKEQTKTISPPMIDQSCQTLKESLKVGSSPIDSCSDTRLVTSEKQSSIDLLFQMSREVQRPKSVDDLEETTTDGNMIRDLFFKCPNFTDNEPLATFYQ